VAILWFGAIRVDSGGMQIGNLIAFLQYVMQVLFSVMMAVIMFVMVPRAAASAERIVEVLETEVSLHDPQRPVVLGLPVAADPPGLGAEPVQDHRAPAPVGGAVAVEPSTDGRGRRGLVELRDVTFRYPGAEDPVLRGVSFVAEPGRTTAIVGSTGSGKSTVLNLIPRFYDVSEGGLLVDGVDVRSFRQEDLWRRIGVVPQRAFLFSGTVASNLRYGAPGATDEELWHALEVAQARDFVEEMPEGLEAPINQGGSNVSGGQRQRLAIARAIVRRPEIYLFDDSFSALDFKTDSLLRAALREETRDATVIIVAQRVGTIMHADRIVVMDSGAVVGIGTHHELLETCETYREIVYSQLSEAEAA